MELIRPFEQLGKADAGIAGGKGASLGEMTQAGISVPPGFVVLTDTFERFLDESDVRQEIEAILKTVRHDEIHTVEHASAQIQGLIKSVAMPEDIAEEIRDAFAKLGARFVAVRSSATAEDGTAAAWAGQLDTFLNTTEDNLLENVQRCWASLFTPRAIFYRFEKGMHGHHISVAVVVQKMIESDSSGIAFSVHPVTEDRNQLIIEAGFGLGEAIVSGQVTPDSYVVTKVPRSIIDKNISTQSRALVRAERGGNEWNDVPEPRASSHVLTDAQILELSELIIVIEQHYGSPQDIEWAFEKGTFYITQSRPITTLSGSAAPTAPYTMLSRIYAREKPLYYMDLWYRVDTAAIREFFDTSVGDVLIIFHGTGRKTSVWMDVHTFDATKNVAEMELRNPESVAWKRIAELLRSSWAIIEPYARGRDIATREEYRTYVKNLSDFWYAINSITFEVADDESMTASGRQYMKEIRSASERYSDRMSYVPWEFVKREFPEYENSAHLLMLDEMNRLIEGASLDWTRIHSRANGCFILNGEVHDDLQDLDQVLATHGRKLDIPREAHELKGLTAFPGKVSGRARIVDGLAGLTRVETGDILITQMTDPKYVPAMQRAAAIVTDEGSMLCHAAITARELKKPCIVGTKHATDVVKDGDLVEVDADAGSVKILERAHPSHGSEYFHHYTQSEIGVLYVDTLLAPNAFGDAEYIHLIENNEIRGYLSQRGLAQARAIGERLLDKTEYRSVLEKTDAVIQKIQAYPKQEVRADNVVHIWDEYIAIWKEMWHVYRYSDEPFQRGLLERVRREVSDDTLANALSTAEFPMDVTDDCKYLIESMRTLGEKRLLMHTSAEILVHNGEQPIFAYVSNTYGLSVKEIMLMTADEVRGVLVGGVVPREEIKAREAGCVVSNLEGVVSVQRGAVFQEWKDRIRAVMPTEIRGTVAYQGVVTGKVVRHLSWIEQTPIPKGGVLVTGMTNPQMIPYLKNAAAIVTDEGGMICHAAILSREMKIPCIVGTQTATQILNDGDLIKVDAVAGVVAILERADGVPTLLRPEQYRFVGLYKCLPFAFWFWAAWYSKERLDALGLSIEFGGYCGVKGGNNLVNVAIADEFKSGLLAKVENDDSRYFSALESQAAEEFQKAVTWTETIGEEDTRATFEALVEHARSIMFYWFIGWLSSQSIDETLRTHAATSGIATDDIPSHISQPDTPLIRQQAEAKKLKAQLVEKGIWELLKTNPAAALASIDADTELSTLLARHVKENEWLPIINFVGEKFTIEKLLEQMSFFKDAEVHAAKGVTPPTFEKYARIASHIGYLNQASAEYFSIFTNKVMPFLESVAKELGVPYRDMLHLVPQEISAGLAGEIEVRPIIDRRRNDNSVIYTAVDGTIQVIDDASTVERIAEMLLPKPEITDASIIKGQIGNKGKARGPARIIIATDDFHKMQDGDVLVTPMTTPDFVLLMQKSAAIVTDMGGMLCHAAIVSREMGKPCVIDTKFATKLLKDGELVEVDADAGTVRRVG